MQQVWVGRRRNNIIEKRESEAIALYWEALRANLRLVAMNLKFPDFDLDGFSDGTLSCCVYPPLPS